MVNATGLQKNTSAAVQSGKHGGDFARCNNPACKHGVGSSECTWNAGQCGHTRQWSSCQVSQCPNWKVRLSPGHKGLTFCCAICGRARNNMCESTWGGGGVCDQGLCQRVQPHSPMGGQAPDMALDNEIEVDAQLKVGAGCRMQQRASKRAIEFEAQERKEKGLPGHKVQVTRHGKIDGACEGKDAWDGAIRSLAPRILNMAAVRVTEQDPVDMARLRLQLDGKFEYVGGELSDAGFRDCVRRYMKGERARLKRRYAQKGAKACPLGVDREQWEKLVIYWQQRDTKTKTEHMVDARGAVANVSHLGRGGKAAIEAKLAS